jgi:hypothetical protein
MVAGHQGIKYIYPTTFAHADSGGFEKPPLRKHKRWRQALIYMRYYLIFFLISNFGSIYAQKYPNIQFDETLKTSEFYVDRFVNRSVLGSGMWILKENKKLKFKTTSDSPPHTPAKTIGNWALYNDTVIFKIKKRTLYDHQINPSKQRPNTLKFKSFTFKWLTETNNLTEEKNPIIITTYCTVLLEKEFEIENLKNELDSVLQKSSNSFMPNDDLHIILQMERIQSVLDVLNLFFHEKKLFYSTRIYLNGNLNDYY